MSRRETEANRWRRWAGVALLGVCWLATSGCGVREYQERAEKTRLRLQQYDEEDQLLGEPIALAKANLPVYLRLPREVSSAPRPNEIVSRLAYFAAREQTASLPVLEAHVGVLELREVGTASLLLEQVVHELQSATGNSRPLEQLHEDNATFARSWESPQLLQANIPVRYSKSVWRHDHEPPRDRSGQPLDLPKDCFAVYRYEIYLRVVEASEIQANTGRVVVAIVFRQLDVSATRQQWQKVLESHSARLVVPPDGADEKKADPQADSPSAESGTAATTTAKAGGASSAKSEPAANIFHRLPTVDESRLEGAKSASLASLRLGAAAEQRLACWR